MNILYFYKAKLQKLIGSHNNTASFNNLKRVGFILTVLMVLAGGSVMAQERNGIGQDETYRNQDELNPNTDSHVTNSPAVTIKEKEVARDTVALRPVIGVNPKVDSQPAKKSEAEDETLSFNVLYFIIQKFKVSDMLN